MVTRTTGVKLWDRRDSGFKWNGNKLSIALGVCQPQEQSVTTPVPLTDHGSQGQGHAHLVPRGTTVPKRTANSSGSGGGGRQTLTPHTILNVIVERVLHPSEQIAGKCHGGDGLEGQTRFHSIYTLLSFFSEIGSQDVVQTTLELKIFLSQPLEC